MPIIKEATLADSKAIAALHTENWRTVYRDTLSDEFLDGPIFKNRLDTWNERLTKKPANQMVFIAEENNQLAGFICIYLNKDAKWGTLIDNLHVAAVQRGKGVGTQLLARAAEWIHSKAPDNKIHLWAYEKNTKALQYYKNLKGQLIEISPEPAADGNQVSSVRFAWNNAQQLLDASSHKKHNSNCALTATAIRYGLAAMGLALFFYKITRASNTDINTPQLKL